MLLTWRVTNPQPLQDERQPVRSSPKDQALLIQKVNDRLELNRSAPKTVLNNQKIYRALPLLEFAVVLVSQSDCPRHRKRESQHHVSGCKTARN